MRGTTVRSTVLRGGFLGQGEGAPRDPRLVRRVVTLAVRCERWLGGSPTRRRSPSSAGCSITGREPPATPRAPARLHDGCPGARPGNVLVDPATVGADLVDRSRRRRHLPRSGQLVGYPILTLAAEAGRESGMADTVAYVRTVEQVSDRLVGADLGLPDVGRLRGLPGVWVDPAWSPPTQDRGDRRATDPAAGRCTASPSTCRRTCAMFEHIVPCGIVGKPVTSLAAEGVDVRAAASRRCGRAPLAVGGAVASERQDVAWRHHLRIRPQRFSRLSSAASSRQPAGRRRRQRACSAGWPAPATPGYHPQPEWLAPGPPRRGGAGLQVHDARPSLITVCEEPAARTCRSAGPRVRPRS